jgi:uncharacterized membrane protein
MTSFNRKITGSLLLITLIGALLRAYQLGFQCYWTEETYTINLINNPAVTVLINAIITDCNPPIYYISAHFAWILLGCQDIAIRYPSLICGILLIPAMYYLGKTFKDKITGLYCAGITAVLFPMVYYSQFGRAYAMTFLFFVLALIFYVKLWNEKFSVNTVNNQVYFSILAAVTVWTHLFAIIPLGLMLIFLFKDDILKGLFSALMFGALVLPLSPIVNGTQNRGSFGMSLTELLVITPTEFFSLTFPYIGLLALIGAYQERKKSLTYCLLIVTVITILLGIFVSLLTPTFPRYFMTVSFIIILFTACACENFLSDLHWSVNARITLLFSVMAIMLAMQYPEFVTHYFVQKYQC